MRLGFTRAVAPKENLKRIKPMEGLTVHGADTLAMAIALLL
jgi:hypothetical protein